jgi:ATP-dependent DNA helicase RecG
MLDGLLSYTEGKTLEFKRDLTSPRALLKTLVAFANTAGGMLFVGVSDDRKAIGIANALDEEERLCSLIADSIVPRLMPNIEIITVDNKTLLVVEVFVSGLRPHWIKTEGPQHGVYVRLGSSSRQADPALIEELRRTADGAAFDELPMPELSLDDLDLMSAKRLFQSISKLDDQALHTLKLVTVSQGRLVPTKGAVLLFGKSAIVIFQMLGYSVGVLLVLTRQLFLTTSIFMNRCLKQWRASCYF